MDPSELAKAMEQQRRLNETAKTEPTRTTTALHFTDGRSVELLRKVDTYVEIKPLNGARLVPGEEVEVLGRRNGTTAEEALKMIVGRGGPLARWRLWPKDRRVRLA